MTVVWHGDGVLGSVRRAVMLGVNRGAESVLTEADRLMRTSPATGRIYKRGSGFHKASAKGEPPAVDFERLVGSLRIELDHDNLSAKIQASTEYAAALEVGTPKIEERPYMRPALANKIEGIVEDINTSVRSVLTA